MGRRYHVYKDRDGMGILTTVIDLADRKIVGWAFSNDITAANTTIEALKMAVRNRGAKQGLVFHSDFYDKLKLF